MNNFTHASLFSGIGGFELGAKKSNIDTIWNCEIDAECRQNLLKNFPNTKQYENIKHLAYPDYVDIISGGFPCQDLSMANTKNKKLWENGNDYKIKGERSSLWTEMWRVIREVRPKYVLIENSPMLLKRGFGEVLSNLSESGYCVEWQCLRASSFGYPHKRDRLYVIAYSEQVRCKNNNSAFRELSEVFTCPASGQMPDTMPTKRFVGTSDYSSVRVDYGLPAELDKKRIEMLGNAVIPEIAHYLFECVKIHNLYKCKQYFT